VGCSIGSRMAGLRLFESAGAPSGAHTQLGWEVDDIEVAVAELRSRGVVFEDVDVPGLTTVDGIAEVSGNYPSKGSANGPPGFGIVRAMSLGSASRSVDVRRRWEGKCNLLAAVVVPSRAGV
jgi:hypothetical protein